MCHQSLSKHPTVGKQEANSTDNGMIDMGIMKQLSCDQDTSMKAAI